MSEWRSIETAPRDRAILVYNAFTGPYVSQLTDGEYPCGFLSGVLGEWYPRPSHWKELDRPVDNPQPG